MKFVLRFGKPAGSQSMALTKLALDGSSKTLYGKSTFNMKKTLLSSLLLFISAVIFAQSKIENIIIITTDGLRWQEVFGGMDSAIANNARFNQGDSNYLYSKYWDADASKRRVKLMPFFWSVIQQQGQLYGNRKLGNKVDNANPYWFSYPGYNEIFTGYPDEKVNSNDYQNNPNTTLLDFLQKQPRFKNRIAAFGAWEAFNRILNEPRAGFPVVAAFDTLTGPKLSSRQLLLHEMNRHSFRPFHDGECLDLFTHYQAMEYMDTRKPKALYVSYGETDEWAHAGMYRLYLDAAHQFDQWVGEIWKKLQADPQYRDKTALFITTDHGRGDQTKSEWTDHGSEIGDAHEIWFSLLAPSLPARGEVTVEGQYYQKQFAQTMASILGYTFTAEHPVGEAILDIRK